MAHNDYAEAPARRVADITLHSHRVANSQWLGCNLSQRASRWWEAASMTHMQELLTRVNVQVAPVVCKQ
jgi:purine nucleoside permease